MLNTIQSFVDSASKENQAHVDSYLQIKKAINKIRQSDS